MRIAVPTNDGSSVSDHFGRSAAFLVFEVDGGKIISREMRSNTAQHSHSEGSCGDAHGRHEPHSHDAILSTLAGCDVVLCGGMGWRAAEALKSGGITPMMLAGPGSAEKAVSAYLSGDARPAAEGYCRCEH